MPSITIGSKSATYNRTPSVCPVCSHSVAPKVLEGVFTKDGKYAGTNELQIAFRCVEERCGAIFIGYYEVPFSPGQSCTLRRTAPVVPKAPSVPAEVAAVSAQFVKIFGQASVAEGYGLGEIAGVGYRKALEFLVKDYCTEQHPAKTEAIRKAMLGKVIDDFVDDMNIKACAKRAAWLGNDETHYVRKWEERDIKDLKILIELTVGWIRNHVLTQQYLKDMPS